MIKYRLEEIHPAPQTLADVPEGEPVDCVCNAFIDKLVRVGDDAHFVKSDGTPGIPACVFASRVKLWRPAAKPLPTTTDQLEDGMVAVDASGAVWWRSTSYPHPIASPIYRVVEVKP